MLISAIFVVDLLCNEMYYQNVSDTTLSKITFVTELDFGDESILQFLGDSNAKSNPDPVADLLDTTVAIICDRLIAIDAILQLIGICNFPVNSQLCTHTVTKISVSF